MGERDRFVKGESIRNRELREEATRLRRERDQLRDMVLAYYRFLRFGMKRKHLQHVSLMGEWAGVFRDTEEAVAHIGEEARALLDATTQGETE